jgi:hypothetical protein
MSSRAVTILALALMACGSSQGDGTAAGNQDLSNAGSTNPVACGGQAAGSSTANLDSCQGRSECVEATVLGILYASNLQLNGLFNPATNQTDAHARAGEYLSQQLHANNTFGKFTIQTSPGGTPGTTKVTFSLNKEVRVQGDFTVTPEGSCVQCHVFDEGVFTQFSFTIANGQIVEQAVTAQLAG